MFLRGVHLESKLFTAAFVVAMVAFVGACSWLYLLGLLCDGIHGSNLDDFFCCLANDETTFNLLYMRLPRPPSHPEVRGPPRASLWLATSWNRSPRCHFPQRDLETALAYHPKRGLPVGAGGCVSPVK